MLSKMYCVFTERLNTRVQVNVLKDYSNAERKLQYCELGLLEPPSPKTYLLDFPTFYGISFVYLATVYVEVVAFPYLQNMFTIYTQISMNIIKTPTQCKTHNKTIQYWNSQPDIATKMLFLSTVLFSDRATLSWTML